MGKEANPYEIRTARQLDSIEGTASAANTAYYKQTHDINGDGYDTYTPNTNFAGHFDGGGYVIKNLDISGGLFSSLDGATAITVKGVILYSTNSITISGDNVGGIAGTVSGDSVTITNCAVAGYSMSGTNVGGLVGQVSGGSLTIEQCEAVNTLTGTTGTTSYVGGLVGQVSSSNQMVIYYSYAGGEITGTATSVGGLLGHLDTGVSASYSFDYSYLDMKNASASSGNYYAIGGSGTTGSYGDCSYLQNIFPPGQNKAETTTNGLTEKSSSYQLGICMKNFDYFSDPNATTVTGYKSDGSTATYPYPAVVQNHNDEYVHYGNW